MERLILNTINCHTRNTLCGAAMTICLWALMSAPPALAFTDDDWSAFGGMDTNAVVFAAVTDDAGNLYIGGHFSSVGGVPANNIAKWDGHAWSALGSGVHYDDGDTIVHALAVSGTNLYAGGIFTHAGGNRAVCVAKWNGNQWSPLGVGVNSVVGALVVRGTNLYAGGSFNETSSGPASRIARWDGIMWHALGDGMNNTVQALAFLGTNLYAGGLFTTAGGMTVNHVARWDGGTWNRLQNDIEPAPGVDGNVYALAVQGTNLFVGGAFSHAGGYYNTVNIARWNGYEWWEVYPGVNNTVFALGVSGTNLYVGGAFTRSGPPFIGLSANYIAKWDGSTWSALGSGLNDWVNGLCVRGGNLYAGGYFSAAGGHETWALARANIDPAPPPMPTVFTSMEPSVTATQACLTFSAEPGTAFDLLGSTNLADWEFKSVLYAGGQTNSVTIDKTRPREFFRLRQLQ